MVFLAKLVMLEDASTSLASQALAISSRPSFVAD